MPSASDRRSALDDLVSQLTTKVLDPIKATWTSELTAAAKSVTDVWPDTLSLSATSLQQAIARYRPLVEVDVPVEPRTDAVQSVTDAAKKLGTDLDGATAALIDAKNFKSESEKATIDQARDSLSAASVALSGWLADFQRFDASVQPEPKPEPPPEPKPEPPPEPKPEPPPEPKPEPPPEPKPEPPPEPGKLRISVRSPDAGLAGVAVTITPTQGSAITRSTEVDGVADFGSCPPGDYSITVALTQTQALRYGPLDTPPTASLQPAADLLENYAVVVLARPTLRVVAKAGGAPIEGVVVTLSANSTAFAFEASGKSGLAKLAPNKPGLRPATAYAIAVSGSGFAPTLDSPNNATFVAGDTKTLAVTVDAPKGGLTVLVNRHDGQALTSRVTFTLAKQATPTTILQTLTTASQTVDGITEDSKTLGDLDPGTYRIAISNLSTLLGTTWKLGPSADGKLAVTISPGQTRTIRFTLYGYEQIALVGFNIKPGYQQGYRCPICFGQYLAPGTCTVPSCGGAALMAKRCPDCHRLYDATKTHCDTCLWNGVVPRVVFDEQVYLGLADDRQDLLARCLVMKHAIDRAHAKVPVDPRVLKIFMAPEFFFRGMRGSYPIEDVSSIMDAMREHTQDPKYEDWLFVYGTAIGDLQPSGASYALRVAAGTTGTAITVADGTDKASVCAKIPAENATLPGVYQWKATLGTTTTAIQAAVAQPDGSYALTLATSVTVAKDATCTLVEPPGTEIFNIALVQHGGARKVAGLREVVVYKEKISHIDFLRDKSNRWGVAGERTIFLDGRETLALPTEGAIETLGRRSNPSANEVNATGIGGGSVFTIDGITYGLEVCLDHLVGRLKNGYFQAKPTGDPIPQVRLVPSWGASIELTSLAPTASVVFNVDGPAGSDAGAIRWTGIQWRYDRLAKAPAHTVDPAAKQDVTYTDTSKQPPAPVTITGLDPAYARLFVESENQVNREASGVHGYAWIVVYAPTPLPEATSFP